MIGYVFREVIGYVLCEPLVLVVAAYKYLALYGSPCVTCSVDAMREGPKETIGPPIDRQCRVCHRIVGGAQKCP